MHGHWEKNINCNHIPVSGLSYYSLFEPKLWFCAERGMMDVKAGNNRVKYWHDSTPQEIEGISNLKVGVGMNSPIFVEGVLGGRNAVQFLGADSMWFDAPDVDIDQTNGEIWIVFQPTANYGCNVFNYGDEGNSACRVSLTEADDGPSANVEGDTNVNVAAIAHPGGYVGRRFCLRLCVQMGETNGIKLYLGDTLYDQETPVGTFIDNAANKVIIADTGLFRGYIGEIIAYDKMLTARQADFITSYLCKRFNIDRTNGYS